MNRVRLLISTAQGPAECRLFARFVLQKLLAEAAEQGVHAEILDETSDKYGIFSASLLLSGGQAECLSECWLGTLQWISESPLRPKHPRKNWYIGVFRLPEPAGLPQESGIVFQTCRAGGKGGQYVNKTESAVRAVHSASGLSVRVESERSQHANKKRARELLMQKLAEQCAKEAAEAAASQHAELYRVERGNPRRVFAGRDFQER
ncbi:MAG: peptide chain release factor H [Neisseria sp.]|uniref:peptide chain release factor H n=1 Tax=Neisseria sp. TaxID=192066 RepID=UPI0026DBBE32|nr:peptide chain release factor H [Neisseria sp.]MDO4247418.1 peptide chain release factor H [Neisseria sp.]